MSFSVPSVIPHVTEVLREAYDLPEEVGLLSTHDDRMATDGGLRDSVSARNRYSGRAIRGQSRARRIISGNTVSLPTGVT